MLILGGVMTFDTMHRTNIYDKSFGLFVGGNGHL